MRQIRAPLYRRVTGILISAVGTVLTAVALVSFTVAGAAALFLLGPLNAEESWALSPFWKSLLTAAISLVMVEHASNLRIAGQRLRQPTGAMVLDAGVPFILLLRSFVTDSAQHPDQSLMSRAVRRIKPVALFADVIAGPSLEAPLVTALAEFHHVVAVGRPGEWLPTLGASRLYLRPDEWQREVERLIVDATFIVLIAGGTQGVLWELQTTLHAGMLPKVLIYVPIDFATPEQDNARWREFRTVLLETLPVHESELPTDFPTDVVIRWVAVDGQLRVRVIRPNYDAAVTELHGSLRAVGQEFAFKHRPLELRAMIRSLLDTEGPASSIHPDRRPGRDERT